MCDLHPDSVNFCGLRLPSPVTLEQYVHCPCRREAKFSFNTLLRSLDNIVSRQEKTASSSSSSFLFLLFT